MPTQRSTLVRLGDRLLRRRRRTRQSQQIQRGRLHVLRKRPAALGYEGRYVGVRRPLRWGTKAATSCGSFVLL
jgi:hypothetical protein